MKKVKGDDGHLKSNDDNECGGGVEYSECIGLNWVAPLASHLLNTIISIFIIISIISIISHHLIIIISITFTFWQPIRSTYILDQLYRKSLGCFKSTMRDSVKALYSTKKKKITVHASFSF